MKTCNNCQSEQFHNNCSVCGYPISGAEKDQNSFYAKQVTQKSVVTETFDLVKNARIILFFLGAFYVLFPLLTMTEASSKTDLTLNIVVGIVFIGFGFLTHRKPRIALLFPLCLTVIYFITLAAINPVMLGTGLLWKLIVLMGLGYGYSSVRKSDTILKENKYLASLLRPAKK